MPWVWGLFFLPTILTAQAPVWGLSWKAPGECIQPSELVQAVEEKLGRPVFGANPEFRIDGFVKATSNPQRWKAKLTLLDVQGAVLGSRDVASAEKNCRALDDSLVLVMALMIDPSSAMSGVGKNNVPPAQESTSEKENEGPRVGLSEVKSASAKTPSNAPAPRLYYGLRGGLSPLPLPSIGFLWGLHTTLSTRLLLSWAFPIYPYAPLFGQSETGWAQGAGLGLGVTWVGADWSHSKPTWLAGLALEVNVFSAHSKARNEILGRFDGLAKGGFFWPSGNGGLLVQLEGGYCPRPPNLRMQTPDGRPEDVFLGTPLRFGVEVTYVPSFD